MDRIPEEYYKLNQAIDLLGGANFLVFMNFGPYKLLPIINDKIEHQYYDSFLDLFDRTSFLEVQAIPFALSKHYYSFLSFVYEMDEFKGVYYCGKFPKVKSPIKIADKLSNIIRC